MNTDTPTCRLCNAEATPENPIDFHSDACQRCIDADERAEIKCTACGCGSIPAESGPCCLPQIECKCGALVDGDGYPRCETCRGPLCDGCCVENENGHDVHGDDECCDDWTLARIDADERGHNTRKSRQEVRA